MSLHSEQAREERTRRIHWNEAWCWIARRRAPANADIWHGLFHRQRDDEALYQGVTDGHCRLSPMLLCGGKRYQKDAVAMWSAQDALVLRWVSLCVKEILPVHHHCVHVAGHRGGRDSLCHIAYALRRGAEFVFRTDIRGDYRNINKEQLREHVRQHVTEPGLCGLTEQYIDYTVENGGDFHTPLTGICRGASLSPLPGASFLWPVDNYFAADSQMIYARYMEDFIFLSKTRWFVRRAWSALWSFFESYGFACHPDKTQVGRVSSGFDWLGLWFTGEGATGPAPRALEN
ncbi:reverse transcriptase domain-containing protein [Citrobacter portucalensis]|uniref:reverse transcriptase domain-containing protein n=1 Tax=Citrobacter portucalensis TaxID=1639133 RepID=UPI00226BA57B|nr:reverse transcriptase domain-containing protein [Citrobacter portucalensis]MCX9039025.1 reverse transcriptase domain-containing protein [Citrobacter portucalensis]MCX9063503.1 reverse transcriptase domain-containing protein [Citrobacter portucalensis]